MPGDKLFVNTTQTRLYRWQSQLRVGKGKFDLRASFTTFSPIQTSLLELIEFSCQNWWTRCWGCAQGIVCGSLLAREDVVHTRGWTDTSRSWQPGSPSLSSLEDKQHSTGCCFPFDVKSLGKPSGLVVVAASWGSPLCWCFWKRQAHLLRESSLETGCMEGFLCKPVTLTLQRSRWPATHPDPTCQPEELVSKSLKSSCALWNYYNVPRPSARWLGLLVPSSVAGKQNLRRRAGVGIKSLPEASLGEQPSWEGNCPWAHDGEWGGGLDVTRAALWLKPE